MLKCKAIKDKENVLKHSQRRIILSKKATIIYLLNISTRALDARKKLFKVLKEWGFPGGAMVKNLPANAGDTGSNLGLGRSHMQWSN